MVRKKSPTPQATENAPNEGTLGAFGTLKVPDSAFGNVSAAGNSYDAKRESKIATSRRFTPLPIPQCASPDGQSQARRNRRQNRKKVLPPTGMNKAYSELEKK
jgi:hypothetical protein